jgi:glutathione S-transferase
MLTMLTLYDYLPSGNCYKVRLLLTQLGIPFRRNELDIVARETRTFEFLAEFPNGRVPAVEFDDGTLLFESNAILWYFAGGTWLLPDPSDNLPGAPGAGPKGAASLLRRYSTLEDATRAR